MVAKSSASRASRPATAAGGSWLCAGEFDRERMLDMEGRLRPARQRTLAILAVAIAVVAPWLGWWPLLFLIPAAVSFSIADSLMGRVSRPENVMFAAWVGSELAIAGAVALEGGPRIPALSWLAIPAITLTSRFSMRGVAAGLSVAGALILTVALGTDAGAVLADPNLVAAPLALLLCVTVLSVPLMRSDIQHRSDAVIDPLTGMLNRKALSVRVHELTQQSQITGEPVGVIVADLDHFKQVNDTHGHSTGDSVLRQVAYLLRKQLRAFDLAYRLGGEEFLILVPGAGIEQTHELAERLREAVAGAQLSEGLRITMSVGAAASAQNEPLDYRAIFAEADAALYAAKRAGRDRVCLAGAPHAVPQPA